MAKVQAKNNTAQAQAQKNSDAVALEKVPKSDAAFIKWLENKLKRVGSVEPNPKNDSQFSIMFFRLSEGFRKFDTNVKATFLTDDNEKLVFTNKSNLFRAHKDSNGLYLHLSCSLSAISVKFVGVEVGK